MAGLRPEHAVASRAEDAIIAAPSIDPVEHGARRPLWSIMIPVCDPDPSLLVDTLESIHRSGLCAADAEVVVVDDASASASFDEWACAVRARAPRVDRNRERVGPVSNWNRCLRASRGTNVHILHPGERVLPGFYRAIERGFGDAPTAGAAFTRVAPADRPGAPLLCAGPPVSESGLLCDWLQHIYVQPSVQRAGLVVRRAVYEEVGGFDTDFERCAGLEMLQRIAGEFPVWFEADVLAQDRTPGERAPVTSGELPRRWQERKRCLLEGMARIPPGIRESVWTAAIHHQVRVASRECSRHRGRSRRWFPRLRSRLALLSTFPVTTLIATSLGRRALPVRGRPTLRDPRAARGRTKRVMLISEFLPHDPDRAVSGGYQRMRRLMEAGVQVGALDVLFFLPDTMQFDGDGIARLSARLERRWPLSGSVFLVAAAPGPDSDSPHRMLGSAYWMLRGAVGFMRNRPTLRTSQKHQVDRVREILHFAQPDIIVADRLGAYAPVVRMGDRTIPVMLDMPDIEHVKVWRLNRDVGRFRISIRRCLWTALATHAERVAVRRAEMTMVCSEHDRRRLGRSRGTRVEILPNTAPHTGIPAPASAPVAMFVGIAGYKPNRDAILRLAHEIWPRVRADVPEAQLVIAGEGSKELIDAGDFPGVTALGFVADLDEVYRRSRVALCPIASGSGTRIKIVEAAFRGRPVVSSSIGAEGLTFRPGREIVIADDDASFAAATVRLLNEPAHHDSIASAARKRALDEYTPERMVDRLVEWLVECAG